MISGLDLNDSGYISVIKPKGWSSNQLLSKLKWLLQIKKAGLRLQRESSPRCL